MPETTAKAPKKLMTFDDRVTAAAAEGRPI